VVYSARALPKLAAPGGVGAFMPPGVLVYLRTASNNDVLAWVDQHGNSVTQSQLAILKAAESTLDTPAVPRSPNHHTLVKAAFQLVEQEETPSGNLGGIRGARFRVYEALKRYHAHLQRASPLLIPEGLPRVIDDVFRYPLRQKATDTFNRQLRSGIGDEQLAELAIMLREGEQLSVIHEADATNAEPQIVCSLGLI